MEQEATATTPRKRRTWNAPKEQSTGASTILPELKKGQSAPKSPIKMEFVTEGELLLASEGFTKEGKPVPMLRRSIDTPNDIAGAFVGAFNELQETEKHNLTAWGKDNTTQFYHLVARLSPKQSTNEFKGDMTIRHILPRNPLDE